MLQLHGDINDISWLPEMKRSLNQHNSVAFINYLHVYNVILHISSMQKNIMLKFISIRVRELCFIHFLCTYMQSI